MTKPLAAADRKLTPLQARFVREYISNGGTNATRAAIVAGYSFKGVHVTAHKLLRNENILAEIKDQASRMLHAGVALGARVLVEMAESARSESVRMQAAQALLDRGGMRLAALTEHHHIIEDRRTDAEILESVKRLSADLGLLAKPIESTATRVEPSESDAPVTSVQPMSNQ